MFCALNTYLTWACFYQIHCIASSVTMKNHTLFTTVSKMYVKQYKNEQMTITEIVTLWSNADIIPISLWYNVFKFKETVNQNNEYFRIKEQIDFLPFHWLYWLLNLQCLEIELNRPNSNIAAQNKTWKLWNENLLIPYHIFEG